MFLDNHVHHERTSPYSPHQNAIAERSNRTVFELAAAIMYDANTPLMLWEYAVSTVIHVLNLMPNKALHLISTPYIDIFGRAADVSHLRVFGCDAYLLHPEHKRPTFGLRALKGIFIGYDTTSLSYLIYHNRKVYKSKDVTFNEDISNHNTESNELLQDLIQFVDANPINTPFEQTTSLKNTIAMNDVHPKDDIDPSLPITEATSSTILQDTPPPVITTEPISSYNTRAKKT